MLDIQLKLPLFLSLVILGSCSGRPNTSILSSELVYSRSQTHLFDLKDSLVSKYSSSGSETERLAVLEKYHQRLQEYLMHNAIDSMKVTIDKVLSDGKTIATKARCGDIEFEYGLPFGDKMSPRVDSIYKFMKGLKEGSIGLINFSFTGACRVNKPDDVKVSTFIIYAFPVPLQYTGK